MRTAAQAPSRAGARPCGTAAGPARRAPAAAAPRPHARTVAARAAVEVAEAAAPDAAPAKAEKQLRQRQQPQQQQRKGRGASAQQQQGEQQKGARRVGGGGGGPEQQQRQQGQQQAQRQRQQPGRPGAGKPGETPLVRVSDNSALAGCAGSVCKAMRGGELVVRVVAVDDGSLSKTAMVLTLANTMAKQDLGQMLSFQPTRITRRSATPPSVPEGATVFYTARVAAGDILTDNTLLATKDSDPEALGRAIIARVATAGHTVLECLGQAATAKALQAVIVARKGLLVRVQDVACVIASTYVPARQAQAQGQGQGQPQPQEGDGAAQQQQQPQQQAPAAEGQQQQAGGGAGAPAAAAPAAAVTSGSVPGQVEQPQKRVLANRIVVLECAPRDPSLLRVRSTYGRAA
ncbi:hypothetical protein Rsub_02149 [Raphidocelis subcapitata]|uniref:Uncharacterized protein n=1 Tax=Raphidocelis subcapitata TaxID=307507 RepID=A0A2V0NRJ6_9CHLO|nr:hypothetical protein Rsub_02149 [Raphidocelis subcapitata]|eukprot:GBF89272.1 hypothetical protein Rsub_02149 [Raphidocelis subcapitata]